MLQLLQLIDPADDSAADPEPCGSFVVSARVRQLRVQLRVQLVRCKCSSVSFTVQLVPGCSLQLTPDSDTKHGDNLF